MCDCFRVDLSVLSCVFPIFLRVFPVFIVCQPPNVKDPLIRVPPCIIWYQEQRFLTILEPHTSFSSLFLSCSSLFRKFPTKRAPKNFCDLLIWQDFVDFVPWICCATCRSSISPPSHHFSTANPTTFDHFRHGSHQPHSRPTGRPTFTGCPAPLETPDVR